MTHSVCCVVLVTTCVLTIMHSSIPSLPSFPPRNSFFFGSDGMSSWATLQGPFVFVFCVCGRHWPNTSTMVLFLALSFPQDGYDLVDIHYCRDRHKHKMHVNARRTYLCVWMHCSPSRLAYEILTLWPQTIPATYSRHSEVDLSQLAHNPLTTTATTTISTSTIAPHRNKMVSGHSLTYSPRH